MGTWLLVKPWPKECCPLLLRVDDLDLPTYHGQTKTSQNSLGQGRHCYNSLHECTGKAVALPPVAVLAVVAQAKC